MGRDRERDRRPDKDLKSRADPKNQLPSAVQHHAREPSRVHGARSRAEPRVLHAGDGTDRQRRGRRNAVAARRRGARPSFADLEENHWPAAVRADRHARLHGRGSRQGQGAFRQDRRGVGLRRGAAPGPHLAFQRSGGDAGRARRDDENRAAHAHPDRHPSRRWCAADGSLPGAGAGRADHGEVLHGYRLPDFRLPLCRSRRSAWSAPSCTARTIPGTLCC